MSALAEALRALKNVLEAQEVPWFVFGAQAVAVRGAPRATQDVDITVDHATDLVVMKILSGRGKDLDDVRSVLARGEADLKEVRLLLAQFEDALARSDLLHALQSAIDESS